MKPIGDQEAKIMGSNIVWHPQSVTKAMRQRANGHASAVLWLTGLSGSGKSTIAHAVEQALFERGCRTYVFDGDNVRHGLCSDLGFSEQDRSENIRRIGELAKLFVDAGLIAITAFISPFRTDRRRVRDMFGGQDFLEVYCRCSLAECENRDVKGLYKKARRGEIKDFTGISSPYDEPENPDLVLDTDLHSPEESRDAVIRFLVESGVIPD